MVWSLPSTIYPHMYYISFIFLCFYSFQDFFFRYIFLCFRGLTTQQGLTGNHRRYRVILEAFVSEMHTDMDGHQRVDLVRYRAGVAVRVGADEFIFFEI